MRKVKRFSWALNFTKKMVFSVFQLGISDKFTILIFQVRHNYPGVSCIAVTVGYIFKSGAINDSIWRLCLCALQPGLGYNLRRIWSLIPPLVVFIIACHFEVYFYLDTSMVLLMIAETSQVVKILVQINFCKIFWPPAFPLEYSSFCFR